MKEALALLMNDIHINKDNIFEFRKNWDEAIAICDENNIQDLIIGGDLFTTRSSQSLYVLLTVKNALEIALAHNKVLTIAEGNHDLVDQEAFEGYCHIFQGFSKDIVIVDEHEILYWEGCDFVLIVMSYFPENGSFLQRLEIAVRDALLTYPDVVKSKADIILYLHQGIHGAIGDFEIPGELPQEPFLEFKKVLCGHYHNRIKVKNTPIEYIGASRQHNFGESEEMGYTILYSDGSTEFIQNQVNVRYKTFVLNADRLDDFELRKDSRYKYKVQVNCTEKQTKLFDKQKWIEKGFDKVEVIAQSAEETSVDASAITEKYDKLGIKKEYQNYCDEKSIDSRLGIKYLEG